VSAARDELRRLVEDLPDDRVPVVLADLKRELENPADRSWPPAFFGAAIGKHTDASVRVDELLVEGFGRSR
jgi:hypothetical protein